MVNEHNPEEIGINEHYDELPTIAINEADARALIELAAAPGP